VQTLNPTSDLTPPPTPDTAPGSTTFTLHIHKDVSDSIVKNLPADRYFGKVYRQLLQQVQATGRDVTGPNTTYEQFRIDRKSRLLYLRDHALQRDRLCIPYLLRQKVFEMSHDARAHQGIHRTYACLRNQSLGTL
jgi:uncharacterized Zn-finger protein